MLAAMPFTSSDGWFGWRRTDSRPGKPTVLRNFVTTRHLLAARTRSWFRMIFGAVTVGGQAQNAAVITWDHRRDACGPGAGLLYNVVL